MNETQCHTHHSVLFILSQSHFRLTTITINRRQPNFWPSYEGEAQQELNYMDCVNKPAKMSNAEGVDRNQGIVHRDERCSTMTRDSEYSFQIPHCSPHSQPSAERTFPCPRNMDRNRKRRAFASNGPNGTQICPERTGKPSEQYFKSIQNSSLKKCTPPSSPIVAFSPPDAYKGNFALSPTTQELSSFGNMTIRSLGSSFASYGRMPVVSDTGSDSISTNMATPLSQLNYSPRHVPLAVVSSETELLSMPGSPRKLHNSDNLLVFGSPVAIESKSPMHESPKFLLPRCQISGSKKPVAYHGRRHETREKPPINFLTLNQSLSFEDDKKKQEPNPNALPTSRSLLKKATSTDSLDDFHNVDGSLSDSGDEGEWFFLCSPKKPCTETEDDSPRRQKKNRPPLPKLDLPTASSNSVGEGSKDSSIPSYSYLSKVDGVQK